MAGERPDYNQLAAIQGLEGATLRVVAVDASGQIIMVPRGQAGNYMSVDASGYLSSIMKGIDGVTLRTIAVDGSGNILGLLQGDYMGAVKTLAVDAQGRMLAVLTDPEDVFGNPNYMGSAELAVRLGAITSHERRGTVIWQDSFESGTITPRWIPATSGAASLVRVSTVWARNGAFSVQLTTGGINTNGASVTHLQSYPVLGNMGLECSFHLASANPTLLTMGLQLYSGTTLRYMALRYNPVTAEIQYLNNSATFTTVFTGVTPTSGLFHTLKMVADFDAAKYLRVVFDNQVADLSAQNLYSEVNALTASLAVFLGHATIGATVATPAYLDDVIVTQNEPAV